MEINQAIEQLLKQVNIYSNSEVTERVERYVK